MATDTIRNPTKISKRNNESSAAAWESLPYDLLLNVYGRLRIEELVVGPPLACRHWYSVSLDPTLYRRLDLQKWFAICKRIGSHVDLLDLLKLAVRRSHGSIERVWFPQFYIQDPHLVFLANTCPKIRFFYLRSLGIISDRAFCHSVTQWKELEGMVVDEHCLKGKILASIGSSCRRFTSLSVVGRLSEFTGSEIVRYLPKLKEMNLFYSNFGDLSLINTLRGCEELESLDCIQWVRLGLDFDEFEKFVPGLKYPQSQIDS